MRGDGSIYLRGDVWWMRFYRSGKPYSESAQPTVKTEARTKLRARVQESRSDKFVPPPIDRITISDLVQDLLAWYATENRKPTFAADVRSRWTRHLESFFGHMRASQLGTDQRREYRGHRTGEGATDTTVNSELQILRKAYRLASEAEPSKVRRVPRFVLAREDNARKVFIDHKTAQKLKDAATREGLWARVFLELAFSLGWRKGELEGLKGENVRLAEGVIRIEDSKNGDPREAPLTPALRVLIEPLVFGKTPNESLWPVQSFRYAWKRICKAAGVTPGKAGFILHDSRRTSARNKRAAGVSESVTMELQGWKSSAMFRRYGIVDHADRLAALRKQEEFEASLTTVQLQSSKPVTLN